MKASESFAKRLSLKVLVSTISLVVLTVILLSVATYRSVSEASDKIASSRLECSIMDLNMMFENVENAAINNIWPIKEHLDDSEYPYRVTWRLLETNPEIVGSTVAFIPDFYPEKGRWYAPYTYRTPGSSSLMSIQMGGEHYDYHSMEWFYAPVKSAHNYWCQPYFDEGGGEQLMTTFSIPIKDHDGRIIAVFTSDVSLADLKDRLGEIKPYENSYAVLVDGEGNYICHPDSSYILKRKIVEDSGFLGNRNFAEVSRKILAGERGNGLIRSAEGKSVIVSYGPLENGWKEAIFTPFEDVYGRASRLILLFEIISVICLTLLYYFNKRIISRESQPITEFTYAALNLGQGKFDARIPEVRSEDEIKRLHDSLHYLEDSISRYITELKTTTFVKERIESELNVASNIQMAMLKKDFPDRNGIDIHAVLHPAKEVGGDLYDCFIKDGYLYFAVGDVSGKGIPAALFMAITLSAFRFISGMGLEMNDVVSRINNSFSEGNKTGMFVTLFVGKINLETLEMEYCNAGHNPIVVISPEGKSSLLHAKPNIAAGLFEDFPYVKETLSLSRGFRLLIYTDGVSEAENASKDQYSEQRLLEFAEAQAASATSSDFVSALSADLSDFTAGAEQNDDITILSIKL